MKLNINEIFYTIQGEAEFTGTPSIFIRLQGCEVGCAWCDTKHTWEADAEHKVNMDAMLEKQEDSYSWSEMSVTRIIEAIHEISATCVHVVITGGEPLEQNIDDLVEELVEQGHTVQIETSGTQVVSDVVAENAWITVSPKMNMGGGKSLTVDALTKMDEIKMPVGKEQEITNLKTIIQQFNINEEETTVWLQPLSLNPKATELCCEVAGQENWNVSFQVHKYGGVR